MSRASGMRNIRGIVDLVSTPRAFEEGVLRVCAYTFPDEHGAGGLVASSVCPVRSDGRVREYQFELRLSGDGPYELRADLRIKQWGRNETYVGGPVPCTDGIHIPLKRAEF